MEVKLISYNQEALSTELIQARPSGQATLHVSDPGHPAANAEIGNILMEPINSPILTPTPTPTPTTTTTPTHTPTPTTTTTPTPTLTLETIVKNGTMKSVYVHHNYTLSFPIKPNGYSSEFSSILNYTDILSIFCSNIYLSF